MVKVLVWDSGKKEPGFWAEFEGEEISSYEAEGKVYTLYRCTAYDFEAYRVHVRDESKARRPKYELYPYDADPRSSGNYARPFDREELVDEYPRFLKDVVDFPTHSIDAELPPA